MWPAISGVSLVLLVAGCATLPQPKPATTHKADKVVKTYTAPCPCSPTANETVKKRWFSGYKVRLFH